MIETEVTGDTLAALLSELSQRYQDAGVDLKFVDGRTGQLDLDCDVSLNDRNYLRLPAGLDTRLKDGDEVKVNILWRLGRWS